MGPKGEVRTVVVIEGKPETKFVQIGVQEGTMVG